MAQADESQLYIDNEEDYTTPILCRAPAYPYRQLIDDDIRLLSIRPGNGILECDLHQMPIADSLYFYALSYVWGSEYETKEILLEGRPFKVTRNLYEALQQFREQPGAPATIGYPNDYFWVDAICLNQEDFIEREYQVSRMMQIYHAALGVLIWLGPNEPMTRSRGLDKTVLSSPMEPGGLLRRGHSTVDGLVGLLFEKASSLWTEWDLPDDKAEEESVLRDVFGELYGAVLQTAADLMQRPWFNRVWTFQESSLEVTPRVFAGRHGVYLDDLVKILKVFASHHRLLILTPGLARIAALSRMKDRYHTKIEMELRGAKVKTSIPECLFEILSYVFGAEATDPRDRLYGLIGFVAYFSEGNLPEELQPNYRLPFEIIYWRYAAYLLQHSGDLRLLSTNDHKLQGVPSWVPDFRDLGLRGKIHCKPTVRVSPDERMLYLQGIRMEPICDTVLEWTDPRHYTSGIQPDLHHRIRYVEGRIFKLASQIRGISLEGIIDDFLRRASVLFDQGGANGIRKAYTGLKGLTGPHGAWVLKRGRPKTTDAFGKDFAIADEMRLCVVLLDDGSILTVSRTLVEIMPDDVVCIFRGANKPSIIRPSKQGDSFVLVSHCELRSGTFCHQLFDDDFWEDKKLEEFRIV
ncbi:putative heterokaryon incompatibility protein [Rosellinia necatrix]|uniref:Putative heterokaryon incompatibility protein n=1 Tax=Rosellinia necatrix TaxID=77044 RepID=A0A1W2TPW7_ROSNE|nr:putative heterokaryon incompatibility protein [Rosellinia necatrix]